MGERIINIRDLIVEILLHWRGIVLWMFVGGIISAMFSYAHFRQSSEAALNEQLEKASVLDLQSGMTQKELSEVRQVLLNEASIEKWNSYIENSVLMSLDSSQVYQEDLIYTILADGIQLDLTGVYVNLLTTNEMYQFAADRTDGFSASDIQELINVVHTGTAANQRTNSFHITILAGTEETCAAISEAMKSYIEEVRLSLETIYGAHNIALLQEHLAETRSMSLLQKQMDVHNKVAALQTETAMLRDVFSEKQKRYYHLRISEAGSESRNSGKVGDEGGIPYKTDAEGGNLRESHAEHGKLSKTDAEDRNRAEEAGSVAVSGSLIDMSVGIPTGLKNAAWGMFFAVLIYTLAVFFRYILDDRLRYTDNCTAIYRIPSLGHIPAKRTANSNKPFRQIDRKLYLLRDKRRYTSSAEEAVRLSVASIAMAAQRKGICDVCGVCGSMCGELPEQIGTGLKADNIKFQCVKNILYSADSLNLLSSVRAAVLIEKAGVVSYGEIQQELEILRRQGIDILGIIIAE